MFLPCALNLAEKFGVTVRDFSIVLVNMLWTVLQGFASNVTFNDINRTEPASFGLLVKCSTN